MTHSAASNHHLSTAAAAASATLAAVVLAGGLLVAGTARPADAATPAAAMCVMPAGSGVPTVDPAGKVNGNVDVLDTLAQVLPARHISGASAASVCSPRDAYASFQIEVSASQGVALQNLSMTASSLTGPAGAVIPGSAAGAASDVQLDREDYTTLTRASDGELDPDPAHADADSVTPAASRVSRVETTTGMTPATTAGFCTDTADSCRFPDALIPDRDSLFGEARNAFQQVTVPAGQNRVVWVDIFVPTSAAAGTYTGSITVSQGTGQTTQVPVQLQVVSATLPATSSLDSAFFYTPTSGSAATYQQYAELGLDDRISVVPQGQVSTTASVVQSTVGPLLYGTDSRVRLQDANGTHAALTDFPMNATTDAGYFATYKSLFTAATKTKPWAYCDEWGSVYCASAYNASAAKQWPGIPLLAIDAAKPSSSYDPTDPWSDPTQQVVPAGLSTMVNGVVDVVQYIDPTYNGWLPTQYTGLQDRSAALLQWEAGAPSTRQVWAYTSNMSGTGGSGYSANKVYSGFPSYGIDQIASEQQAMGWQLFTEHLNGELYWDVNENPQITSDPNDSHNQYLGLNGDGTLFYPWNATQVGGTDPIPLESIRLKRIRDGRQDYELLHMADTQGLKLSDGRTARTIASTLFPAVSSSAVTTTAVDAAEQDVFRLFPLPSNPVAKQFAAHDPDCNGTTDFLAVQAGTGNLLFYPRTATDWAPNAPTVVGTGFGATAQAMTYTQLMLAGDLNGDGSPDLLGRKADGSLWLMAGNCTGTFGTAVATGASATAPTAVGDFNGDSRPDVLDKHSDGTVWLLAGNGKGGFAAPTQVGAGWGSFTLTGVQDANGDGAVDVLARTAGGTNLLYEGTGTGGWKTVNGGNQLTLSLPTATYPTVIGGGDINLDGHPDLIAIDNAGKMWAFDGDGQGGYATTGIQIGAGWTASSLTQVAQ
jgi:Domain of unknown function (DUF4091)/FG-GAP-like repeat/Family of unknown function (DUF6067)